MLPDGTLEYQVVGSSENDEGRIFRSDPDFATDGKKLISIELRYML